MNQDNSGNALKRNVGKGLVASTSHASSATQKMSKNKTNEKTRNMRKILSNITNVGKKRTLSDANLCNQNDERKHVAKRNFGKGTSSATQEVSTKNKKENATRNIMRKPLSNIINVGKKRTVSDANLCNQNNARKKLLIRIAPTLFEAKKNITRVRLDLSNLKLSEKGFHLHTDDDSHPHYYSKIDLGQDDNGKKIPVPSSCKYLPSYRVYGGETKSYFPANFSERDLDNVFEKINKDSGWTIDGRKPRRVKYVGETFITDDENKIRYKMIMVLHLSDMNRPVILTAYPLLKTPGTQHHFVSLDQYVHVSNFAVPKRNKSVGGATGAKHQDGKDGKMDCTRSVSKQEQKKPAVRQEISSISPPQNALQQNDIESTLKAVTEKKEDDGIDEFLYDKTAKEDVDDDDEVLYVKTVIPIDDDDDDEEVILLVDDFDYLDLEDSDDDDDEVQFIRTVIVL